MSLTIVLKKLKIKLDIKIKETQEDKSRNNIFNFVALIVSFRK